MSVLDTFYLLFKTDAAGEASKDIANLDKQISTLAAKGKARNEAEVKELKELRRQRSEATRDLKDQTKEVGKLGDSFTKLVETGITALTTYASFSAFKSGLLDASKLNSALAVQGKITNQNAGEMRAYAAALAAAGGHEQDLYGFVNSAFQEAASRRIALPSVDVLLRRLHDQIKGKTPEFQAQILGQNGAMALAPLLEQSDEEFNKSIEVMKDHEAATNKATKASREFEQQMSSMGNTMTDVFSKVGEDVLPVLTKMSKWVNEFINDKILGLGAGSFTDGSLTANWDGRKISPTVNQSTPGLSVNGGGKTPLGIRNNNPGNLMPGGREASFSTPQAGIAALASQLGKYGSRGWDTVESIISHYAPPNENNTEAYISSVLRDTGFKRGQRLNLSDPDTLKRLIPAIIKHENGYNPYDNSMIQNSISSAQGALSSAGSFPLNSGGGGSGGDKSISIKTGDINVHTQATDSAGIARDISSELKNQFRTTISNFDDGVLA